MSSVLRCLPSNGCIAAVLLGPMLSCHPIFLTSVLTLAIASCTSSGSTLSAKSSMNMLGFADLGLSLSRLDMARLNRIGDIGPPCLTPWCW